ncbi:hypothetical protein ACOMHN_057841 [Nucella lapillus]
MKISFTEQDPPQIWATSGESFIVRNMSVDCDEDGCIGLGESGLLVGTSRSKTEEVGFRKSEIVLLELCLPFVIMGIISNIFILWIWSAARVNFCGTIYLFKALAVADLFYLTGFLPTRFYNFHDFHSGLFFRIITHGNRTVAVCICLMLAVVRFIRLYFPSYCRWLLSPVRLKGSLALVIFFSLTLQTLSSGKGLFLPREYMMYIASWLKRILMISMPAVAQNVVMLVVLLKLWQVSRRLRPGSEAYSPPRAQSPANDGGQAPSVQNPGPVSLQTLFGEGVAATGEHRVIASEPLPITQLNSMTSRRATTTTSAATQGSSSEPQYASSTQKDLELEPHILEVPRVKKSSLRRSCSPLASVGSSRVSSQRRVSFATESATRDMHHSNMRQVEVDRKTTYVVFAICFTSLLAYPVCAALEIAFNNLLFFRSLVPSYACHVIELLNSGINIFFYLFISSFKKTFRRRKMGFVPSLLPSGSLSVLTMRDAMEITSVERLQMVHALRS